MYVPRGSSYILTLSANSILLDFCVIFGKPGPSWGKANRCKILADWTETGRNKRGTEICSPNLASEAKLTSTSASSKLGGPLAHDSPNWSLAL